MSYSFSEDQSFGGHKKSSEKNQSYYLVNYWPTKKYHTISHPSSRNSFHNAHVGNFLAAHRLQLKDWKSLE